MFVQALAEYADTYLADELGEEAFEKKPVPYFIELDSAGTFLNRTENAKQVQRGKKIVSAPESLVVPKSPVARNAGIHPLLAGTISNTSWALARGQRQIRESGIKSYVRHSPD